MCQNFYIHQVFYGLQVNGLVYDIYKNGMRLIYVYELYNLLC